MPPTSPSIHKDEPQVQALPPTHDDAVRMDVPSVSGVVNAATLPGPRRHLRGRRGGLKDMPTMPLDILFEIFAFMHPRELLNLARTTRAFRALLMSKQSAQFWKQARKQIEGLPDPPYYLSEPQYANLLFFPHCHNCLKPGIQTVIWVFSVRYCKECQKSLFSSNFLELETLLWDMLTVNGIRPAWGAVKYHNHIFRQHDGKILKQEIEDVRIEWAALQDQEEKEQYLDERRAFAEECRAYSQALSGWKESYQQSRSSELDAVRAERLAAVHERLRDEGWGHVLDGTAPFTLYRELTTIKTVNRANKLTNKAWKAIREAVVEVMKRLQKNYIEARLVRICEARLAWVRMAEDRMYNTYNARLGYLKTALDAHRSKNVPRTAASDREPGFAELAIMPAFRHVLMRDESDEAAVHASLQTLLADLPALWEYQNQEVFAEKALDALGDGFEDLAENPGALLDLAIVSFVCTKCNRARLRWPGLLAHVCFRRNQAPLRTQSKYEFAVMRHTRAHYDAPFRGDELTVFDRFVHITRVVITACGLDPKMATFDQVEACGARFVYWYNEGWQKVYDWQALIRDLSAHQDLANDGTIANPADYFHRVSDRQAAAAIEEAWTLSASGLGADLESRVFGCALCTTWGRFADMQSHLRMSHDVRKAESELLGGYLYLHEDSKPRSAPEVWLTPEVPEENIGLEVLGQ